MLKVRYENEFQKLIYNCIPPLLVKNQLHKELKTTKTKVTRLMRTPEEATLDELLFFAEKLDCPPYILHTHYKVGTITDRECQLIKEHYEMEQPEMTA